MSFDGLKRLLRTNELTRKPYLAVARTPHAMRLLFYRLRFGRSFPPFYFDDLFADGADPWNYEGDSVSETRKRLILDLLPPTPVSNMLEIGCASGWMTRDLSSRAKTVTAIDCSAVALSLARERCRDRSNIEFAEIDLLADPLAGSFAFVLCAGVLNFFPRAAQPAIRDSIVETVEPGGRLLLEHLKELMPGYEVPGEELHRLYADHPQLTLLERRQEDIYEIVLFQRAA